MEKPFLNCQDCCKWCVVSGCPYSTVYTTDTVTTNQIDFQNNINNYGKKEANL